MCTFICRTNVRRRSTTLLDIGTARRSRLLSEPESALLTVGNLFGVHVLFAKRVWFINHKKVSQIKRERRRLVLGSING